MQLIPATDDRLRILCKYLDFLRNNNLSETEVRLYRTFF